MHEEEDRNVLDFLLNVAPLTLVEFMFEGYKNRLNVSFYLEGLHAVLKSTTRIVEFSSCMFSSSEFQSILIAAKHHYILRFHDCKLDVTDEFDISQETFHIRFLELFLCGEDNGWNNNMDGLKILVKAVSNSSLKHSLRWIWIWEIEMDTEYKNNVKEIFERHDLQHVLKLTEL